MAKTTIDVTYKPDSSTKFGDFKAHLELIESVMDVTLSAPSDVKMGIEKDYDDDTDVLVASWTV